MFAEDELLRRKAEREAADQAYNDALTALDGATPSLPAMPHPPLVYDEHQIPTLNERWQVVGTSPTARLSGWRRWLAEFVWEIVRPALERQQAFNSTVVDHINRNVVVHRSTRDAVAAGLDCVRAELEKLEHFHNRLILFVQSITLYVDTKDRSEHAARLVNLTLGGHHAVTEELGRRWESMVAREQRFQAEVGELRTLIGAIQHSELSLKRALESVAAGTSATQAPSRDGQPAPTGIHAPLDAHKYVGFEAEYRGPEATIRERQARYLSHFEGRSDVLDIGCGRGEFLSLLAQHGISARGLDVNREMVERGRAQGLVVEEGDALEYLLSLPDASLGGLMAAQVVEHLEPAYLLRFLETAYHKLRPGSPLVLETINPSCWAAFFQAYILDITHVRPLHPLTLKYLVVASGFQQADIDYSSPYPEDARLQPFRLAPEILTPGLSDLAARFNDNVDRLNRLMFGYMDYAVVAKKR